MMTPDETDALIDRIVLLAEYYGKPKSDAQISLYVRGLQDLALADVLAVMNGWVVDGGGGRYFPLIVEIRERIVGNAQDAADLAWTALVAAVRHVGWTGHPTLPPATIDAVRAVWGSWGHLCETLPGEGPELLGWAKRFTAVYQATRREATRHALPSAAARAELAP